MHEGEIQLLKKQLQDMSAENGRLQQEKTRLEFELSQKRSAAAAVRCLSYALYLFLLCLATCYQYLDFYQVILSIIEV